MDASRNHEWQFMVEPTSMSEPRTIIGVCQRCGVVKPNLVGRQHSGPRVDVTGDCEGRTRTGYSPTVG